MRTPGSYYTPLGVRLTKAIVGMCMNVVVEKGEARVDWRLVSEVGEVERQRPRGAGLEREE